MPPRLCVIVFAMFLSCSGCALLGTSETSLKDRLFHGKANRSDEATDAPVRSVVHLEASVVVQPTTDQRVRRLVWEELDESGLMVPAARQRLNNSGFRVGVLGGSMPWSIRSLVEQSAGNVKPNSTQSFQTTTSGPSGTSGFTVPLVVSERGESQIEVASADEIVVPSQTLFPLGESRRLSNVRFLLNVTVQESDSGWVKLRFLPQIHFGSMTKRYSIENGREELPTRQQILPLYEQQFDVKLHQGESIVLGHVETSDWSVGDVFFRSESLTGATERLLVLNLRDLEEVTGQKGLTVNYGKY